ncbi:ribosomal protein L3 glutamine methyltransferase [Chitinivorax tropicus]|uniref:Ribosomal protein uL3 glutamine methyltransferase n=1 Tax=Chitinivorax tropicus TaxID=714531 RepID=A0A840MP13_9PROT|nr:50S ribosomal protein L3 N(5)-glutamine methyltransferase [Chitinivorax tropicus]MBB5020180.1 ribosomal protein L3 glutamine methyltransferase [Chitinivorax tropicus]
MFDSAASHLHTVRDLIRFAVSRFNQAQLHFGHGTDNAYDEAVYLVLHTLKLPIDRLEPFLDARLLPEEINQVLPLIRRRVEERKPAAYLTHEAWLGEYRFYVDERVIVPRSFISELLRQHLAPWVEYPELIHRGLDLCTGSGCLAIMMADAFPDAEIDAIDLSSDALAVAARNVEDYRLGYRVNLLQSDMFVAVQGHQYDLIVSNPPYVDAESVAELPTEYLQEPEMALGSGHDGLDATRIILDEAPALLTPHGILVVEIGHNRALLEEEYPELPFTWLETSGGDGFVFLLRKEDFPT